MIIVAIFKTSHKPGFIWSFVLVSPLIPCYWKPVLLGQVHASSPGFQSPERPAHSLASIIFYHGPSWGGEGTFKSWQCLSDGAEWVVLEWESWQSEGGYRGKASRTWSGNRSRMRENTEQRPGDGKSRWPWMPRNTSQTPSPSWAGVELAGMCRRESGGRNTRSSGIMKELPIELKQKRKKGWRGPWGTRRRRGDPWEPEEKRKGVVRMLESQKPPTDGEARGCLLPEMSKNRIKKKHWCSVMGDGGRSGRWR